VRIDALDLDAAGQAQLIELVAQRPHLGQSTVLPRDQDGTPVPQSQQSGPMA
jgi:hypothetical protein